MRKVSKMLEKITKKAVDKVKQTVKEETHKTTKELKRDVINGLKEAAPMIVAAIGAVLVLCIARPKVTVKVVVKQV